MTATTLSTGRSLGIVLNHKFKQTIPQVGKPLHSYIIINFFRTRSAHEPIYILWVVQTVVLVVGWPVLNKTLFLGGRVPSSIHHYVVNVTAF